MRVLTPAFAVATITSSAKCGRLSYNAVCFIDSAERQDLSLIPPSHCHGKTRLAARRADPVQQLATLMDYEQRDMVPAPGRESALLASASAGRSAADYHCWCSAPGQRYEYDSALK